MYREVLERKQGLDTLQRSCCSTRPDKDEEVVLSLRVIFDRKLYREVQKRKQGLDTSRQFVGILDLTGLYLNVKLTSSICSFLAYQIHVLVLQ